MRPARAAAASAILAGMIAVCPSVVHAQSPPQSWPQRGVKIVTPLPAGTGVDLTARLYADGFAKRWGQPVVVENRVGADGIAAAASFVAARDDHTLLLSIGAPFTTAPLTVDTLPYDPVADFTPVCLTAEQFLAVGAAVSTGIATLAALEARAKAEPGKLIWAATTGLPQLAFTSFVKRAGLDMAHLVYRDAATPLTDLGESRLHVYASGMASLRPQIDSGKARFLALLGRNRYAGSPDTPTVGEAGYPHMTVIGLTALFGWKGMPTTLRDRLAGEDKAIAADPALQARLATAGLTPRFETAETVAVLLAEQRATVAGILGK